MPLQFSIETFLRGSYSFQAKEDCILANLELVKTIVELKKKIFFSAVTAAAGVVAAMPLKEFVDHDSPLL